MSYYTAFKVFDKFAHQSEAIAQALGGLEAIMIPRDEFVFVDVGSNDGTLLGNVKQLLKERHQKVKVYACEPDQNAYDRLKEKTEADQSVHIEALTFQKLIGKGVVPKASAHLVLQ